MITPLLTWYLVWITTNSGGGIYTQMIKAGDYKTCLQLLKETKVTIPSGGDSEQTITVTCSTEPPKYVKHKSEER